MNQKLFLLLLPTIFIVGILMVYRSYRSIKSLSGKENDKFVSSSSKHFFNSSTVISTNPVDVEFFVMSKCPDAIKCETLFLPSVLNLSSIVNFTLVFIAAEPKLDDFRCMHGVDECTANQEQLCIQHIYPQVQLIKYLQCQAKQDLRSSTSGEQCAKNVGIKWSNVQSCVTSNKGHELFRQSLERTRLASVKKSCTIYLQGKFWCMHDGYWKNCAEGNDETSFIKAICSRYKGKKKPSSCTALS